jgi:hypothetical protein
MIGEHRTAAAILDAPEKQEMDSNDKTKVLKGFRPKVL